MYETTLCHEGWISIYGFLSTAALPTLFSLYELLGSNYVPSTFWTRFLWLSIYYGVVNVALQWRLKKESFQVSDDGQKF